MRWTTVAVISVCFVCLSTALPKTLQGKYRDCWKRWDAGEREAGIYVVYPNGTHPVKMYCNHTETGSATVIQQRSDGSLSFFRYLQDYQNGFGHPVGNYWAGLETLYHITKDGKRGLSIVMSDWLGNNRWVHYTQFQVMDRTQYYRLFISGYSGTVPDDMAASNGMYFYTPDYPDQYQCAVNMKAGWWYNYCAKALPNGVYYVNGPYHPSGPYYDGIYWEDWLGFGYSLKYFRMSVV